MSLTRDIKDFALDLGYSAAGITTAEPFTEFVERIQTRSDSYRWIIDGAMRIVECAAPTNVMPAAKSIISTVYDYGREGFPAELTGKIGRLYLSRTHNAPRQRIHGARRQLFREFLERKGMNVMMGPNLNVPDRMAAARAGVATFGKNNFVFSGDAGSFAVLISFVVDVELEYDQPTMEAPCPEDCRLCIDACPSKALQPFRLEPHMCVSFNNSMTQNGYGPSLTDHIPPEIRPHMGSWIHGCDVCQEVCPRNQHRMKARPAVNEFLSVLASRFDLRKVLLLTDEYYESEIKPVAYNYLRQKKYFQRNAAIALGNSGDRSYVPDLIAAMEDPEPLVRGYAAWALGRLGGERAKGALQQALSKETDERARGEIALALAA